MTISNIATLVMAACLLAAPAFAQDAGAVAGEVGGTVEAGTAVEVGSAVEAGAAGATAGAFGGVATSTIAIAAGVVAVAVVASSNDSSSGSTPGTN